MSRRRFTTEEDELIIKKVSEHPGNLLKAFREVAEETGRHYTCVSSRWYKYLSERQSTSKVFMLFSKKRGTFNRKIVKERKIHTQRNLQESKWRRILNIIFE